MFPAIFRTLGITLLCFTLAITSSHARNRKIKIKNADSLVFSQKRGQDIRILYGNVQFEHEGGKMFCDSAYFYSKDNSFDAFSKVHINQNDSVDLYGDTLYFDGNTRLAKIRGKQVKLVDGATTLTTQFLDYDMKASIAYYYNGGHIVSSDNTLDSRTGRYLEKQNEFFFKDHVKLVNPDYTIDSDTLRYNTVSETAFFFGPTTIVSEENFIYCENGWYNTKTDISQFKRNAYLNNGPKYLYGDSLYYDRGKSYGEAFQNVIIKDTVQKATIYSNYGYYREKPEYILITDSVRMVQVIQEDSLFLHGDTIIGHMDSTETFRLMKIFHKVRFFKSDLQGKCDSMVFTMQDTTLEMHQKPVIWSDLYQVDGTQIDMHVKDSEIDRVYVTGEAFICSQQDSIRYNQVSGANMTTYIKDRNIYKLDVFKNGETIYFLYDETELVGINKAQCSDITVIIEEQAIKEIVFKKSPTGTMFPPYQLSKPDLYLQGFEWKAQLRPTDKWDIFNWRE